MRNRRTLGMVVLLLVVAALGGWLWYARTSAAQPDDEIVDKAGQLDAAFEAAGGKAVEEQEQMEAAEAASEDTDTEMNRGPMQADG